VTKWVKTPTKVTRIAAWIKKTWYLCIPHTHMRAHAHTHWNITQSQKRNNSICNNMDELKRLSH